MWHRPLWRIIQRKDLWGGEERKEENGLGGRSKAGSVNPADFRPFSFSFLAFPSPLSLNYPHRSLYIPWEIGLNGVDQNRFSKINAFRRRTVSNDRDNATNQSIMIRDIQMRIHSIKNRSLGRAKDGTISVSIRDFLVTFRIIL